MNWLKQIFESLFKPKDKPDLTPYSEEQLNALKDQITMLEQENTRLAKDNNGYIDKIGENMALIESLNQQIKNLKGENQMQEYWDNKRPKARIVYKGRYLPMTKTRMNVPVQLFIDTNDIDIISDLKHYNLEVTDPNNCDDMILKIYKHTRTKPLNKYRYVTDIVNVGVSEFWYFPFELRFAKKGDCDDWGNELASYLISAGVPRYRVRCVVGDTWDGFGHHTVYVLSDDNATWYHLNSTNPYSLISGKTKLSQFPKSDDPNDDIGIKDVWFSYNDKSAWHEFETEASAKSFKKEMENIKITPEV